MKKEEKDCQIWLDCGCEGWEPIDFNTLDEAIEYLKSNSHSGARITKKVILTEK